MKLKSLFAVAFLALGTLACSGLPGASSDPLSYMPTAELTAPWTEMNLPIGDGKVTMSDGKLVTVMYNGDDVSGHFGEWSKAIVAAGFKNEMDLSTDPSTKSAIFDKGGKKLTMTATTAADITTVSLSKPE